MCLQIRIWRYHDTKRVLHHLFSLQRFASLLPNDNVYDDQRQFLRHLWDSPVTTLSTYVANECKEWRESGYTQSHIKLYNCSNFLFHCDHNLIQKFNFLLTTDNHVCLHIRACTFEKSSIIEFKLKKKTKMPWIYLWVLQ